MLFLKTSFTRLGPSWVFEAECGARVTLSFSPAKLQKSVESVFEVNRETLAAHIVSGVPWVPGAAMICAVVEAGMRQNVGTDTPETAIFTRVTFREPFQPGSDREPGLSVILAGESVKRTFQVRSVEEFGLRLLCDGQLELSGAPCPQSSAPGELPRFRPKVVLQSSGDIYDTLSGIGVDYRDALRIVTRFSVDGPVAIGEIRTRASEESGEDHGVRAFDAVMQCALLLWAVSGGSSTAVPFAFERAILPIDYPTAFTVSLQRSATCNSGLTADVVMHDRGGRRIGVIEGLVLKALRTAEHKSSDETGKLVITVSSFFTGQPLCRPLEAALTVYGENVRVAEAPYGQVLQGLLDETPNTDADKDVRLVLVRAEDFISHENSGLPENVEDFGKIREAIFPPPTDRRLPNGMRVAQLNGYETDYLYREIFESQSYRDDRVELPDDAVIIDIGANIGMFSLSMASDLTGATILAFEPSPQAFAALEENVRRFGGRVQAFNCGIGRAEEIASFTVYPNSSVFSGFAADPDEDEAAIRTLIRNALAEKGMGEDSGDWVEHFMKDRMEARTIECRLRPLSAVIDDHDIRFVDLLKIDVEKSEVAVLDGIRDEHWSRFRQVIIEVHDLDGSISGAIQNRLRNHGFEVVLRQESELEESGLSNIYAVNRSVVAPAREERTAFHKARAGMGMLVEAARQYRNRRSGTQVLIAVCPPSPWAESVLGSAWIRGVEDHLIGLLADEGPDLAVIRAGDHLHVGPLECADALSAEMGDIPYKTGYFEHLATVLAQRIVAFRRAPYKVLVLDCDNTLWGGVCGETTPDQLDLGEPFLSFRRHLKELVAAGYLLCLCSKNDLDTVRNVFLLRDDSILEWDDFVAVEIGWGHKSQSLRSLSERLDLGLPDFAFFDDNPVECAEVHANCPEVLVIRVPNADEFAEDHFRGHWALRAHDATAEDVSRTKFYQQNMQRNDLKRSSLSLESFLQGLKLEVRLLPVTPQDLSRAAQLTARTSQFTIHKQARDADAIAAEIARPGDFARLVHVFDRFGDYGITGLIIARRERDVMRVGTFLLSCRVLGKGVEERLLSMLADECGSLGIRDVWFDYVKSARNTPARLLLERLDPEAVPKDGEMVTYRCSPERLAALLPTTGAESVRAESALPAGSGRQALRAALVALFARTLGVEPSRVDPAASFDRLGVSSLQLIDVTKGLDDLLGRVNRTILFEKQTIDALVDHFAAEPVLTAVPQTQPVAPERVPRVAKAPIGPAPKAIQGDRGRIAVVGIAGRFPMARDTRAFWANLLAARDCTGTTSDRPWLSAPEAADYLRSPYTNAAGLIDGPGEFDAGFFGISPEDAMLMSPQQRLFLQEAWNALEDGGYRWKRGGDEVGVFVGSMADDYALVGQEAVLSGGRMYADADIHEIANRTSYLFDFTGPSMAVDTACSSSLTALHLACASLRLGECHSALVGGVNLIAHRSRFVRHCDKELLSRRGVTASFADDADGFVDGEGVGCLLLRPLQDAVDDGDFIYGVVLGSAINSRGRSGGFHAPGARGHRTVIEKAYAAAGVAPASVSCIEAQGAGSALGDGIELEALAAVHSLGGAATGSCVLGSLKPNIGHLEAAAGIAGVIKVMLQMTQGMIVPMAASGRGASPAALAGSAFVVQNRPLTWLPGGDTPNAPGVRRAGVAAFGATGSNAFVVLEEGPRRVAATAEPHVLDRLIVMSAHSEKALEVRIAQLRDVVRDHVTPGRAAGDVLARLAHSLQVGRRALGHRVALVVSDLEALTTRLDEIIRGDAVALAGPDLFRSSIDHATAAAELNPLEARSLFRFVQHGDAAAIASLWTSGADIDWMTLGRRHVPQKLPMPGYPFAREVFWLTGGAPGHCRGSEAGEGRPATVVPGTDVDGSLAAYLHARLGVAPAMLDPDLDLHRYGATSLFALRLVAHLNAEYGLATTIDDLSRRFTARGIAALIGDAARPTEAVRPQLDADLIARLEKLALAESRGA
jgi:FkbH-like protein/FkbM family methyltransferase